jgi:hypothetical protein
VVRHGKRCSSQWSRRDLEASGATIIKDSLHSRTRRWDILRFSASEYLFPQTLHLQYSRW